MGCVITRLEGPFPGSNCGEVRAQQLTTVTAWGVGRVLRTLGRKTWRGFADRKRLWSVPALTGRMPKGRSRNRLRKDEVAVRGGACPERVALGGNAAGDGASRGAREGFDVHAGPGWERVGERA